MSLRSRAALDYLFPLLQGIPYDLDIHCSGDYSEATWKPILDGWQQKIRDLWQWTKSLRWLDRWAYRSWLDFYQRRLNATRDELRTKACDQRMKRYEDRQQKRQAEIDKFLSHSNFPTPPKGKGGV